MLIKIKEKIKHELLYRKYREYSMLQRQDYTLNLNLAQLYAAKIDGSIVELGVWKGGMIAGMAELLGDKRKYYLFDSFEGLPKAKDIDGKSAIAWQNDTSSPIYYDNCTAHISYSESLMKKLGVSFEIHKGWFSDTLSVFAKSCKEKIAILRLDADWYESTFVALKELFPLVEDGGIIIIDDYYTWDGCSRAIHDYLSSTSSSSRIRTYKGRIAFIIKSEKIEQENA